MKYTSAGMPDFRNWVIRFFIERLGAQFFEKNPYIMMIDDEGYVTINYPVSPVFVMYGDKTEYGFGRERFTYAFLDNKLSNRECLRRVRDSTNDQYSTTPYPESTPIVNMGDFDNPSRLIYGLAQTFFGFSSDDLIVIPAAIPPRVPGDIIINRFDLKYPDTFQLFVRGNSWFSSSYVEVNGPVSKQLQDKRKLRGAAKRNVDPCGISYIIWGYSSKILKLYNICDSCSLKIDPNIHRIDKYGGVYIGDIYDEKTFNFCMSI